VYGPCAAGVEDLGAVPALYNARHYAYLKISGHNTGKLSHIPSYPFNLFGPFY